MSERTIKTVSEATQIAVAEFGQAHGLTVKIGYLGNLEERHDFRIWFIWVENVRGANGARNNVMSLGDPTKKDWTVDELGAEFMRSLRRTPGWWPAPIKDIWGQVVTTGDQSKELVALALRKLAAEAQLRAAEDHLAE